MTSIHRRVPLSTQVDIAAQRLAAVSAKALPNAIYRSINRVGAVSERQTVRDVAKSESIAQKAIRPRVSAIRKAKASAPTRRVKLRLQAIPAASIGKPRQTKKGVTVRKRRFPGAFVADGSKGKGKYQPSRGRGRGTYQPTRLTQSHVLRRTGRGRYPLEVVTVEIATPLTNTYQRNVRRAYNHTFPVEMTRHLAKEMNKLTRKW